ncbi:hypothetical protein GMMP1_1040007 [Candidatus Magnetomoraceae bacterium gMMP-1]
MEAFRLKKHIMSATIDIPEFQKKKDEYNETYKYIIMFAFTNKSSIVRL